MMRSIDPLSHQPRVSKTNQQNAVARPNKEGSQSSDSVEISQGAQNVAELADLVESAPAQSKANLEQIRERVQSGFYNTQEALEAVADAIVDSDGLRDTVAEIAQFKSAKQQLDQVPDVRADAVERARELAGNGFYNQRDALEGTADGLINEIA